MNDAIYSVAAFAGALYLLKRSKKPDPPDPVLEDFRAECMADGQVVCNWTTLETRLVDQTVSGLWWKLTRDERYSVAEAAVDGLAFGNILWSCSGLPMCAGPGGDWVNAQCIQDGVIRYLKFVNGSVPGADSCYYKYREDREVFCYVPDVTYNLPGGLASIVTPGGVHPGYGHTMCALQIDEDKTQHNSWVIFQYSDFDIRPPHWQMPTHEWDDMILRMRTLDEVCPGCGGTEATLITRWNFKNGVLQS